MNTEKIPVLKTIKETSIIVGLARYHLRQLVKQNKIKFVITGNGFLYNMVRIIVGTLLEIEKIGEENIVKAFTTGERSLTGKTMPPNGLYLKKVEYFDKK